MSVPPIKPHSVCRACGLTALERYLDLGTQAPANALRSPDDASPEFTAPLSVSWCAGCGLSQLDQVVDPALLYPNYPFRAGTSETWRQHCAMLMTSLEIPGRPFLIDIGSNDGTLLEEAVDRGWKVLGVDPEPIGALPSIEGFWSSGMARRIARLHGHADVVTATNVFGHVDDAKDFLEGVALVLRPRGLAIIECPHIFPLLEQVAFDTIYHEHLSYWSLRPLELVAESVGLKVIDVRMYADLHGGTMRYTLTPSDAHPKVSTAVTGLRILESAQFEQGITPYREFATQTHERIDDYRKLLRRHQQKRTWGYGASAKGSVLIQTAGPGNIERIVDDCEAKWGFYSPGAGIPIGSADDLSAPDVLVLLSWNNGTALQEKAMQRGFTGEFISVHG